MDFISFLISYKIQCILDLYVLKGNFTFRGKEYDMYIVHVFVHVKPDAVDDFKKATLVNAKASVLEPGIARFDVLQDSSNPNRFVLVEVYRTEDDPARHKETDHYKRWNKAVADMMAEPRTKHVYQNIYPDDMR
jgi:(4S)-4-hydroxy-5-phosphonooxypentane-2,3-dione isomerase